MLSKYGLSKGNPNYCHDSDAGTGSGLGNDLDGVGVYACGVVYDDSSEEIGRATTAK